MGKSIKGTRTEKNLAISFAGESQARMRYTYLRVQPRRKVSNRFQLFSWKPLNRKRNMPRECSSGWKVEWWKSQPAIQPE